MNRAEYRIKVFFVYVIGIGAAFTSWSLARHGAENGMLFYGAITLFAIWKICSLRKHRNVGTVSTITRRK